MNRYRLIKLLFFFVLLYAAPSIAQQRTDFVDIRKLPLKERLKRMIERKISLQPFAGLAVFPGTISLDQYGLDKNIYAGFSPGFSLGFGSNYKASENVAIGGSLAWTITTKNHYSMNLFGLNAGGKYYFIGTKKRFSPYAAAGLNLSFVNLNRSAYTTSIKPDINNSDIQFGTPENIGYRHVDLSTLYGPLIGVYVTAGVDYRINGKYGVFLQASYNPTLKSPDISTNFPGNISDLQFYSVRAGITIKLFKPKPPEIDTNMIYIPDDLIAIDMPEDHGEGRMLVREGVFDVVLREGLKHNVRVGVGDHELLIDEEVQDPCQVTCYLYDEKGDILSSAQSTPEGKIVFSDIEKGIYDLVFVLEKPCQTANFKYKFPDPNTHPLMQYNTEGGLGDSLQYNIEGTIHVPDSADYNFIYNSSALFVKNHDKNNKKNYDITVMLSNENDQIIQHVDPGKDEKFAFRKLTPGIYDIIYKVPDVEIRTGFLYTVFDNYKRPLKKETTDSSCDSVLLASMSKSNLNMPKYTMKGKITFLDTLVKPEDVTLYLVNCFKKIESIKKPNADGTFTFGNLHSKNDYKVFYELKNPSGKIDLMYRVEDPAQQYQEAQAASKIEVKVINGDMQVWSDHTEYDIKGNVISPKGYAVQVGASDNIKSINTLCKRLMEDNFGPIAIQVQGTGNLNRRFAFSKDFKLFKVLVGIYESEKEAIRQKYKLEFFGFDAYVLKHFD